MESNDLEPYQDPILGSLISRFFNLYSTVLVNLFNELLINRCVKPVYWEFILR